MFWYPLKVARVVARSRACMNNLKQIQLAWVMYSGDNGDKIVPVSNYTGSSAVDPMIQPGATEAQLFPGNVDRNLKLHL